jgi:hypothetical protein
MSAVTPLVYGRTPSARPAPPLSLVSSPVEAQPENAGRLATHLVGEACRAAWQDGYYHAERTHHMQGWRAGFLCGCLFAALGCGICCAALIAALAPA